MKNWKIRKWTGKPERTNKVSFACPDCGNDALLEVAGRPMAQVGAGLVFDIGDHSMPEEIQCPNCKRRKKLA